MGEETLAFSLKSKTDLLNLLKKCAENTPDSFSGYLYLNQSDNFIISEVNKFLDLNLTPNYYKKLYFNLKYIAHILKIPGYHIADSKKVKLKTSEKDPTTGIGIFKNIPIEQVCQLEFWKHEAYLYLQLLFSITDYIQVQKDGRSPVLLDYLGNEALIAANAFTTVRKYRRLLKKDTSPQLETELRKFCIGFLNSLCDLAPTLASGTEIVFPCGYNEHAIYLTFVKDCNKYYPATFVLRIDNLREEDAALYHHKQSPERIKIDPSDTQKISPYLLGKLNIGEPLDDLDSSKNLIAYLKDLCIFSSKDRLKVLPWIYNGENYYNLGSQDFAYKIDPLPPQQGNFCVYENFQVGVQCRIPSGCGIDYGALKRRELSFAANVKLPLNKLRDIAEEIRLEALNHYQKLEEDVPERNAPLKKSSQTINNLEKLADKVQGYRKLGAFPETFSTGNSSFENQLANYRTLDKSLFIKHVIDSGAFVIIILSPKKSGKSLNLQMLRCYLTKQNHHINCRFFQGVETQEGSQKIYHQGLKIWEAEQGKYQKYQGCYPVIWLTFHDATGENYIQALLAFRTVFYDFYKRACQTLPSISNNLKKYFKKLRELTSETNVNDVFSCLRQALTKLVDLLWEAHGERIFLLIDEYDTPLYHAHVKGYHNELHIFFQYLLAFLKHPEKNAYLVKTVLMGILRISREELFPDAHYINMFSTLNDEAFSEDFSVTEQELPILLPTSLNREIVHNELKKWYGGYHFGRSVGLNMCSLLCSLASALSSNDSATEPESFISSLKSQWAKGIQDKIIFRLINQMKNENEEAFCKLYPDIVALAKNSLILVGIDLQISFSNVTNSADEFWSFLLVSGYLTITGKTTEKKVVHCTNSSSQQTTYESWLCHAKAPNEEIRLFYQTHLLPLFTSIQNESIPQLRSNLKQADTKTKALATKKALTNNWLKNDSQLHELLLSNLEVNDTSDSLKKKEIESLLQVTWEALLNFTWSDAAVRTGRNDCLGETLLNLLSKSISSITRCFILKIFFDSELLPEFIQAALQEESKKHALCSIAMNCLIDKDDNIQHLAWQLLTKLEVVNQEEVLKYLIQQLSRFDQKIIRNISECLKSINQFTTERVIQVQFENLCSNNMELIKFAIEYFKQDSLPTYIFDEYVEKLFKMVQPPPKFELESINAYFDELLTLGSCTPPRHEKLDDCYGLLVEYLLDIEKPSMSFMKTALINSVRLQCSTIICALIIKSQEDEATSTLSIKFLGFMDFRQEQNEGAHQLLKEWMNQLSNPRTKMQQRQAIRDALAEATLSEMQSNELSKIYQELLSQPELAIFARKSLIRVPTARDAYHSALLAHLKTEEGAELDNLIEEAIELGTQYRQEADPSLADYLGQIYNALKESLLKNHHVPGRQVRLFEGLQKIGSTPEEKAALCLLILEDNFSNPVITASLQSLATFKCSQDSVKEKLISLFENNLLSPYIDLLLKAMATWECQLNSVCIKLICDKLTETLPSSTQLHSIGNLCIAADSDVESTSDENSDCNLEFDFDCVIDNELLDQAPNYQRQLMPSLKLFVNTIDSLDSQQQIIRSLNKSLLMEGRTADIILEVIETLSLFLIQLRQKHSANLIKDTCECCIEHLGKILGFTDSREVREAAYNLLKDLDWQTEPRIISCQIAMLRSSHIFIFQHAIEWIELLLVPRKNEIDSKLKHLTLKNGKSNSFKMIARSLIKNLTNNERQQASYNLLKTRPDILYHRSYIKNHLSNLKKENTRAIALDILINMENPSPEVMAALDDINNLEVKIALVRWKKNDPDWLLKTFSQLTADDAKKFIAVSPNFHQITNKTEDTALHIAASYGWGTIVNSLLLNGAELNATNRNGQTPLMLAIIANHETIVTDFLQRERQSNTLLASQDYDGLTPFLHAARLGFEKIMTQLFAHDSDTCLAQSKQLENYLTEEELLLRKNLIAQLQTNESLLRENDMSLLTELANRLHEVYSQQKLSYSYIAPLFICDNLISSDLNDLFSKFSEEACQLFVTGSSGMGKSSLIQYIVDNWDHSSGKISLFPPEKTFSLVIAIKLRELSRLSNPISFMKPTELSQWKKPTLIDIVLRLAKWPLSKGEVKKKLAKLLEQESESGQVLWLLDGYDEISENNLSYHKKLLFPQLKAMPFFILTSRFELPELTRTLLHCQRLRILGLSDEGIKNFSTQIVSDTEEFIAWLHSNPNIQNICRIPIYLEIACRVWEEKNINDSSTFTRLYDLFTVKLCNAYYKNLTMSPKYNYSALKESIEKNLNKFSELAHTMALTNKLTVELAAEERNLLTETILTYAADPVYSYENTVKPIYKSFDNILNKNLTFSYSFYDKTFQDYFLASYLVNLGLKTDFSMLNFTFKFIQQWNNSTAINENLCLFIAGMLYKKEIASCPPKATKETFPLLGIFLEKFLTEIIPAIKDRKQKVRLWWLTWNEIDILPLESLLNPSTLAIHYELLLSSLNLQCARVMKSKEPIKIRNALKSHFLSSKKVDEFIVEILQSKKESSLAMAYLLHITQHFTEQIVKTLINHCHVAPGFFWILQTNCNHPRISPYFSDEESIQPCHLEENSWELTVWKNFFSELPSWFQLEPLKSSQIKIWLKLKLVTDFSNITQQEIWDQIIIPKLFASQSMTLRPEVINTLNANKFININLGCAIASGRGSTACAVVNPVSPSFFSDIQRNSQINIEIDHKNNLFYVDLTKINQEKLPNKLKTQIFEAIWSDKGMSSRWCSLSKTNADKNLRVTQSSEVDPILVAYKKIYFSKKEAAETFARKINSVLARNAELVLPLSVQRNSLS